MKFATQGKAFVSDAGNLESFTMVSNAKSFSLIIGGVYKNPILAIIRELSTNAIDAHKEAGTITIPFEVSLPTKNDPNFYIRDYGTGLSPEVLANTYFKAFASTKDQSNEYTGSLGIGRLSVLAYNSQAFTLESFYNGTRIIYQCSIGPDGTPKYIKALEESTNEPNGVKILFSCKIDDIEEFNESAANVYQWFDLKPKVLNTNYKYKLITITKINDLYSKYSSSTSYSGYSYKTYVVSSTSYAVMGNIAYPITTDPQLDKYNHLVHKGLILPFEIGEVDFTASREALRYTKKTVNSLINRYEAIIDELKKDVETKIAAAKTEYEAYKIFYASNNLLKDFMAVPPSFKYNGKEYPFTVVYNKDNCYISRGYKKVRGIDRFEPNDSLVLVKNDLKVGWKSRCFDYATTKYKNILLVDNDFPLTYSDSDVIMTSTMPAVSRGYSQSRNKVSSFMEFVPNTSITNSWKQANSSDVKDSKYYVIRKGYKSYDDSDPNKVKEYSPSELLRLKTIAGIKNIYAVTKQEEKSIIKLGFVNFFTEYQTLTKKRLSKLEEDKDFIAEYTAKLQFKNDYYNFFENAFSLNIKHKEINNFNDILSISKFLKDNKDKYNTLLQETEILSKIYSVKTSTKKYEIDKSTKDKIAKFKLLNKPSYYFEGSYSDLRYYVLGVIQNG
jgi:hypothetical protein